MLNPYENRLDYGDILAPPDGYQLDYAVGTTYSLDFKALVGVCIALDLEVDTDSEVMNNPIYLLKALRNVGDKIALFCEAGQIHFPRDATSLYILLEKMVFQVVPEEKKGITSYPSFHPKFWVIRYINEEKELYYRIVVLSRNLTFDRSWDVSFYMDGEINRNARKKSDKNQPVSDFIKYLIKQLPKTEEGNAKSKKMSQLARELNDVTFSTGMKQFDDYEFIPTGIPCSDGGFYSIQDTPLMMRNDEQVKKSFHELFVMSPFLSNDIIKQFNERSLNYQHAKNVLITRTMALEKLKLKDCDKFQVYVLKDTVMDGEIEISEGIQECQKQDIHAKIFMIRKYADAQLYLGSMNASHNAFFGNIEFMICLKSKNRYLNLDKLMESIFNGPEDGGQNPFIQVDLKDVEFETRPEKGSTDIMIKQINRYYLHAEAKKSGNCYDVHVSAEGYEENDSYQITLKPLLSDKIVNFQSQMVFEQLQLLSLSQFYVLSIIDKDKNKIQRVLKIETDGIPMNREKKVISQIIGSHTECFYRYLEILLGDDGITSIAAQEKTGKGGIASKNFSFDDTPILYEKMLQTAAKNPERLLEIDALLEAVSGDNIKITEFHKLYSTFRKVVN